MKYTMQEHKDKKLVSTDNISEQVQIKGKIKPESIQQLTESAKDKKKRKLIVQMEAIHVGRTANYTFYTEQGLKDGLESWTHPYSKPVLTHHNSYSGEPIGRILKAEFAESTISGRKGLIFTCEITDPEAVEKVLDGRYSTVSIGASTDKVTCNICGTDRTKEWCEHWRGEEYEGQTCHYVIGTTQGREVSYVNVPADENAGNFSVSIEDDDESDSKTSESAGLQIFQIAEGLMQSVSIPEVNLYESASDDIKELVDGLMNTEEGGNSEMKYQVDENGNQILDENGNPIPVKKPESNNSLSESELQEQLTEAQKEIKSLEGKLSEAQSALSTITIEKTKVDNALAEAEANVERLTTENAGLIEKAHKVLAEKVVDMKLALRKSDVVGVSKEEAIEAHVKRTEESLNDAVQDLQSEMKDTKALIGSVPNPADPGTNNNPNENRDEIASPEEAINLFKNMFGGSKKK